MFPCLLGSFMLHIPKCIVCNIPGHQLSAPASRTCFMLLPLGFQTPEEDVFRPQNISKKPCHKVLGKTIGYIIVLFMIRNVPSPNVTLRLKRWVSGHSTNFSSTKDGETYTYSYIYIYIICTLTERIFCCCLPRLEMEYRLWRGTLGVGTWMTVPSTGAILLRLSEQLEAGGMQGVESKQCRKMCVLFFVFCFF